MMTASRIRSITLFVLVLISLIISYAIWHGDWLNRSEAGFADTPTTTGAVTSSTPDLNAAMQPYQIVLQSGQTGQQEKFSVELPGTSGYENWLQQLADLSINGLKPMLQSNADGASKVVQIEFGTSIERASIQQLVPSLRNAAFADGTQTITLYQTADGHAVMMELSSPGDPDVYTGRTDINPVAFSHLLTAAVTNHPWLAWNFTHQSFLPQKPQTLKQYHWTNHSVPMLPLIHSFFVNPGALTRIQEQNGQVLWTDGSRAVQWSNRVGVFVFDDPNAASTGNAAADRLATAISFIHDHGGGPANLLVYSTDVQSTNRNNTNYLLRPVVDGLPVLNTTTAYQLTLDAGHVVEFQRPTTLQATGKVAAKVTTLSGMALIAELQKQLRPQELKNAAFTFGYTVMNDGSHHSLLEPAVVLTGPTGHRIVIDAVTGQVLKGGHAS